MAIDLHLVPIYRLNGQEPASMPGLLAVSPPRKPAHGREQDQLMVYLLLIGNATVSISDYKKIAADSASAFFESAGTVTNALRAGAVAVNQALLGRNQSSTGSGQHITGLLALACLRAETLTVLMSGPLHLFSIGRADNLHLHDPSLSGKGLGLSQAINFHLSQAKLNPSEQMLICGRLPGGWESALVSPSPISWDATRRRLRTLTSEDLNAVLIQASEGGGKMLLIRENPEEALVTTPAGSAEGVSTENNIVEAEAQPDGNLEPPDLSATEVLETKPEPELQAHMLQPSAYAIPAPQPPVITDQIESASEIPGVAAPGPREFPASIPRAKPQPLPDQLIVEDEDVTPIETMTPLESQTGEGESRPWSEEPIRKTARALVTGIQSWKRISARIGNSLQSFLPRLLPGSDPDQAFLPSTTMMVFIAVLIPIVVVSAAFSVYSKYGRSVQYENALGRATESANRARTLTDPIEERRAWEVVMLNVEQAEGFRKTGETKQLKEEAGTNLDELLGILRLQFTPAFSNPPGINISRMAAGETDLFMLDASSGEALHAELSEGRGFQLDTGFNCSPGLFGGYSVGPLVDILALPGLHSLKATMLGVDATGNLLYCEPGQVAQAIPLPPPDTNWGRVTAFTIDAGNMYVLDAPFRALWVFPGVDDAFIDRPYFFFGDQTPEKQDVIDLAVSGDDLYMLHADGHLSTCSYSRIEAVPTRCQDPAVLIDPHPASQGEDIFNQANFTQMLFTAPPDQSILLLDSDSQAVFRLTPRSLELQNQLRPTTGDINPIPSGPVGAMTVSPNHVLYLSIKGQVYFATGMP